MAEIRSIIYQITSKPLMMTGMVLIAVIIVLSIFAPVIAPYDPIKLDAINELKPPSSMNLFGTDTLGRDIFSRVVYGSRISIQIGIVVVSLAMFVGTIIGIFSGYIGGLIDEIIMRITDIFLSIPYLILAMAIAAALGPSLINTMIALSVVWWPSYARLVRGQALLVRENTFIEAARGLGASQLRIIFRHLLPNCIAPVIVQASLDFGNAIMYAAALSFIGLGAQPPTPEWGAMISEGRNFLRYAWWFPTFPGIAIFITVLGSNLLGDGLRDILDPRLKEIE